MSNSYFNVAQWKEELKNEGMLKTFLLSYGRYDARCFGAVEREYLGWNPFHNVIIRDMKYQLNI